MLDELIRKTLDGDRRSLSRLFTIVERSSRELPALMQALHPYIGGSYCIGITGPPGAGKSTIVDGLVAAYRREGAAVAVLAVDPTSPFTGGAVLGDRIRMRRHFLDPGVYIRSVATRGARGGLSPSVMAAVRLLDAAGTDVIIVESVGVGQTELDVANVADTVVVVLVPEAGDAVQVLKAGLVEIADVFVVNKADRQGAGRIAGAIGAEVGRNPEGVWRPPVLLTEAHRRKGIDDLHDAIADHRAHSEGSSELQRRRAERRRLEFTTLVLRSVQARLDELKEGPEIHGDILRRVELGEIDPYSAAAAAIRDGHLVPRPQPEAAPAQGRPPQVAVSESPRPEGEGQGEGSTPRPRRGLA